MYTKITDEVRIGLLVQDSNISLSSQRPSSKSLYFSYYPALLWKILITWGRRNRLIGRADSSSSLTYSRPRLSKAHKW